MDRPIAADVGEATEALEKTGHEFTGLYIAVPCGSGRIRHETMVGIMELMKACAQNKVYAELRIAPQDSLIMRARNALIAWFMASKCSHMFCIDDDIQFDPRDVFKMLKDDKDFVCGAYRRKADTETYTVAFHPSAAEKLIVCAHCGCVELDAANVGFALLHRNVFDRMFAAYPDLKCENPPTQEAEIADKFYALFNTGVENNRMWGEDYWFSKLWMRCGGKIWLDPTIVLTHFGTKGWTGNIGRWFLANEAEPIEVSDAWKEIQGWLTDPQAKLLVDEVQFLKTGATIVELGSWRGRSTALLGMAAAAADRGIRVYAVDHFMGSEDERGTSHSDATLDKDGIYPDFLENLDKVGVLGRAVVPIVSTFAEAVSRFEDESVDLLFVDGSHSRGDTLDAFTRWARKVKPGGCVVFHDHNWPGVKADIEMMKLDVTTIYDMAVWRKPKEASDAVQSDTAA